MNTINEKKLLKHLGWKGENAPKILAERIAMLSNDEKENIANYLNLPKSSFGLFNDSSKEIKEIQQKGYKAIRLLEDIRYLKIVTDSSNFPLYKAIHLGKLANQICNGVEREKNFEDINLSITGEGLLKALDTITENEKKVLILRFGLENNQILTLEEVGQKFGVTRERILCVQSHAMRKLRHPCRTKLFVLSKKD